MSAGTGIVKGGQVAESRDVQAVQAMAQRMRCDIVRMLTEAGSGHPGGSLSAADIVAALYFGGIMEYDPAEPRRPGRDRFILSKGHAAPVLYAALARAGYFPVDELSTLRKLGSRLQGHPDSKKLPGVEVCTGSLGQGLSISAGMALGMRMSQESGTVFTLLGDGELEEGQVWEAAMFANQYHLDNLVAIVDNNHLQIDGHTYDVMDSGDVAAKFAAFGWTTFDVDGHDAAALIDVLHEAVAVTGAPVVIVAHTVKGKGVSFMEDQAGWHGKAPDREQCACALAELENVEA